MARIRTIKPETWTSLDFTGLPKLARLTFIAMWNYADDHGRLQADPRLVKAFAWPLDDDVTATDVADHLFYMEQRGMIRRYTIGTRDYFEIVAWASHQRVDNAGKKSAIPAPGSPIDTVIGGSPQLAESRRESPRAAAGEGGEGSREQGGESAANAATPSPFCEKHRGLPPDRIPNCRACGNARMAWELAGKPQAAAPRRATCPPHRPHRLDPTTCLACGERIEVTA